MDPTVQSIKSQIDVIKARGARRLRLPDQLWRQIAQYSSKHGIEQTCRALGLDPKNAKARIRHFQKEQSAQELPPMIQLSSAPSPVLELTLANKTIVRVYSP